MQFPVLLFYIILVGIKGIPIQNNFKKVKEFLILVATGEPHEDIDKSSEILDLTNKNANWLNQQNMVPFEKHVGGATGALVDGKPLICGGNRGFQLYDECYIITKSNISLVTNMNSKRADAASVVVNNTKLWVLGGWNTGILNSTEYVHIGEEEGGFAIAGPDLPVPAHRHAVVSLNSSCYMLISGKDAFYYKDEGNQYRLDWVFSYILKNESYLFTSF